MRIFNKLVFSKKEPSNENDIWFDGKVWKIFLNGKWEDTNKFREDITTPDWNAVEGEVGYIDNRTHYLHWFTTLDKLSRSIVDGNIVIDVFDYMDGFAGNENNAALMFLDETGEKDLYEYLYGFRNDMYSYILSTMYNIESITINSDWQIVIVPVGNPDDVYLKGFRLSNPSTNYFHINTDDRDTAYQQFYKILKDEYLPYNIARKEYVDEKILNNGSLVSTLKKELPVINIDVSGWVSGMYTFAQLGITNEYVDKWLVLSLLKIGGGAIYGFETSNSNGFSELSCEIQEGSLFFYYEGSGGKATIQFDIIREMVYISNDWE